MTKKKHPLIGRKVHIDWRDPDSDWNEFRILDMCEGLVKLEGFSQEGAIHDGIPFWVPVEDIKEMLETADWQRRGGHSVREEIAKVLSKNKTWAIK